MFIILICLAGSGVALLLFALIKQRDTKNTDQKLDKLDNSLKEAENIIFELDDLSNSVRKEIDEKYQEMLQLYSILDEKKNESIAEKTQAEYKKINKNLRPVSEKASKIKSLYDQGYTVSKIAQLLKIGQGEVNLTLNLNRERSGV